MFNVLSFTLVGLNFELTSGDDIILCIDGNSSGINFGTDTSSRSPDRRARHLKAPRTDTDTERERESRGQ